MNTKDKIKSIENLTAKRAPFGLMISSIRIWYLVVIFNVLAVVIFLIGVYLSVRLSDWAILGRFGAFISVVGSYLIARPIWRTRFLSQKSILVRNNEGWLPEQIAEFIQDRADIWSFYSGFIVATCGTIIWGFADLLNCISGVKCPF